MSIRDLPMKRLCTSYAAALAGAGILRAARMASAGTSQRFPWPRLSAMCSGVLVCPGKLSFVLLVKDAFTTKGVRVARFLFSSVQLSLPLFGSRCF